MKIIYVHHGNRNKSNPPTQQDGLTKLGVKDAKILAKLLKQANKNGIIKAIYTSTYFRCVKTAKLINKYIKVKIIEDARFNEYVNVHKAVKGEDCSSNESWLDCQLRIRSALYDIVKNYNNNDIVLCVTSGVNITAFISLAYKIQPSNNLPFPLVPGCSPIGFDINIEDFDNI